MQRAARFESQLLLTAGEEEARPEPLELLGEASNAQSHSPEPTGRFYIASNDRFQLLN